MLTILGKPLKKGPFCDGLSRRNFLQVGGMVMACLSLSQAFVADALAGTGKKKYKTILYSVGTKPLQLWDQKIRDGHIKRITDNDLRSSVFEIVGPDPRTTYITFPRSNDPPLKIKHPSLVMRIKNLDRHFMFEVHVLDDTKTIRVFNASTDRSTTRVKPSICTIPMRLDEDWNDIQFDLVDFVSRTYQTKYVKTVKVIIHSSCRIRRIYFSDQQYNNGELPPEFKLFRP